MKNKPSHIKIFLLTILAFTNYLYAQEVQVIKAPQLYKMMENCDAELCVYNFWATWCAPCVREIPHFEKLSKSNENIQVKLISLDDIDDIYTSVKSFMNKRNIHSEVFLLDETDFNEIIPKVNDDWSGAIPATLIVDRSGKRYFYEKEFKEGELNETLQNLNKIPN
jgi:thiol-disulfide isomerase/thioredoxin